MHSGSMAMQITGYQPTVNDRFANGFPGSPVRNAHLDFVGMGFDWTGVGWNSGSPRVGYGFVTPRHHVLALHFKSNNTRRIFGNDDVIHTLAHQATVDLGLGHVPDDADPDLSVSRLVQAIPASAGMPRYPVLDLNNSSSSNNSGNYNLREVFLYGHWGFDGGGSSPRIAKSTISSAIASGVNHSFQTLRTAIQLEGNDSGSPAFLVWENPDGGEELAIIGNHSAVNGTHNIHNFLGSHQVMAAIHGVTTVDGYALRVEGEPSNTWIGSQSIVIGNRRAWGLPLLSSAPSDRYVTFNGATAGNDREVSVAAAHNLRGLYFRNTGSTENGFLFTGTAALTIGRGGVNNLDVSQQVIEAPLVLGDHQYWDAGSGGVVVHAVQTNGHLLNIRSPGLSHVRGTVSGSGGIALEGGQLHIEADATYTGKTWVHHGKMRVDGDIRTSERLFFETEAVVSGHGKLPVVDGRGRIEPDGILTAESLVPATGMGFHFQFAADVPDYSNAAASPNDLLRLKASPPLSNALTAANPVAIYLEDEPPLAATTMRGGFFFDDASATTAWVTNAASQVYVEDPEGDVMHDGKNYSTLARDWSVAFVPESADFADGNVEGLVMRLEIEAAAGTYATWAAGIFPIDTPEADRAPDAAPFGDGVPNLLAYALALDPLADKSAGMPTLGHDGGFLAFRHRRNLHADDVTLVVETSDDLNEWADAVPVANLIDPDVDGDGGAELLETSFPADPQAPRRFIRLRVQF